MRYHAKIISIIPTTVCPHNTLIAFTCHHLDLVICSIDRNMQVPSFYSYRVYLPFVDLTYTAELLTTSFSSCLIWGYILLYCSDGVIVPFLLRLLVTHYLDVHIIMGPNTSCFKCKWSPGYKPFSVCTDGIYFEANGNGRCVHQVYTRAIWNVTPVYFSQLIEHGRAPAWPHCLVNLHITGHPVFVVSAERIVKCPVPPAALFLMLSAVFMLKTWVLQKPIMNYVFTVYGQV